MRSTSGVAAVQQHHIGVLVLGAGLVELADDGAGVAHVLAVRDGDERTVEAFLLRRISYSRDAISAWAFGSSSASWSMPSGSRSMDATTVSSSGRASRERKGSLRLAAGSEPALVDGKGA